MKPTPDPRVPYPARADSRAQRSLSLSLSAADDGSESSVAWARALSALIARSITDSSQPSRIRGGSQRAAPADVLCVQRVCAQPAH